MTLVLDLPGTKHAKPEEKPTLTPSALRDIVYIYIINRMYIYIHAHRGTYFLDVTRWEQSMAQHHKQTPSHLF